MNKRYLTTFYCRGDKENKITKIIERSSIKELREELRANSYKIVSIKKINGE